MKTGAKKALIIIMSIVCLLLAAIIALSLITIKPISKFGEYQSIKVLNSYNSLQSTNEEKDKNINKAVKTVKFSLLRAIAQGSADYIIKPVIITEADGSKSYKNYNTQAFSNITAKDGEFMLGFYFNEYQTSDMFLDEKGNKIVYDTLILVMPKGKNVIQEVKIYPLLSFNMENELSNDQPDENGHIASVYYRIYEFKAKMYTNKMYEILKNDFKPGSASGGMQS